MSRSELKAYVDEMHKWLQETHQLEVRKAAICVAISQLGLNRSTLTTRKTEVHSVVLAAARASIEQFVRTSWGPALGCAPNR